MPSDVGVKLGVSGVSQFKSAMNSAKSSVKQLDAELKLNAAQYKASGDAEEYMAGRSRILSQQIKAQEEVVSNCQKALETMASQGVDKASASYTQMAAQLARAKTDLIQMQQAARGAGEEMEEVAESTDKTATGLEKIASGIKFQNVTTALGKVESVLKSMFSHAVNIGKAIAGWERGASDWADTLITDASMYGMDVETLQRWQYAAKLIDTEVDTIVKAQDKLMAKTGSTDGIFAMLTSGNAQYAVRVRDANGALRDQGDVLWDFLDVLKQVDSETDRNALAQEYFGKSYRELIPLINAGRDGWEKAAESATIVDEEHVTALGALNDAYVTFDQKLASLSQTLAAEFAPAMEEVLNVLGVVSDQFMAWLQSDEGKAAIKNLGDAVAGLVGGLAEIDWSSVFEGATNAINNIAELLKGFDGEDILNGLKTVGEVIAGWKVGKTLLEFMTFAKSFKGLGGGSGAKSSGGSSGSSTVASSGGSSVLGFLGRTALRALPLTAAFWVAEGLLHETGNDEGIEASQYIGKLGGRDLSMIRDWRGTSFAYGKYGAGDTAKPGDELWYRAPSWYSADQYDALEKWMQTGAKPAEDLYAALYGEDGVSGALIQINKDGEMFYQTVDDVNASLQELQAFLGLIEDTAKEINKVTDTKDARMAKNYADALLEEGEGAALDRLIAAARAPSHGGRPVGATKAAEEVAGYLTEGFDNAVAESVKAARMDKNYADILDEEPLTGELTEAGLKTIRDYTNAWMMAQQMHAGRGIDPDMLGSFDMDLMHSIWKNLFPEDFAQQSGFGAAIVEMASKAGEDASSAFGEGAMANVEAAFAAGAALASAFASGAASVRPAGGGDTTNNFNSVGNVNVYGAQSPAEIAAAYNSFLANQQAGYGG